jgi:ribosomal protein L22
MTTKLKATDARVRIANQKIEMIATEIANTFDKENTDKTDSLIEILYMKTIRKSNNNKQEPYQNLMVQ